MHNAKQTILSVAHFLEDLERSFVKNEAVLEHEDCNVIVGRLRNESTRRLGLNIRGNNLLRVQVVGVDLGSVRF